MADQVVDLIGSSDANSKTQAKEFLKRRYMMLYDAHLWEDAKISLTLTTYDNQVILPAWVDKVLQVVMQKGDLKRLLAPMDRQNIYQINPYLLEESGDVIGFSHMNPVATHMHPPNVKLSISSSDATDTGSVRVQGMHLGNEISETVTLSGTSDRVSQNYYDEIYSLSKPKTAGYIRVVTSNAAENELQVLLEDENERKHQRIQLHRDISEGHKLLIYAKHSCTPLSHDNDTPQLKACTNALISFAVADMLTRMRQSGKAQAHVQEANAHLVAMMGADKNQRANVVRFVPEDSYNG